MNKQSVSPPAGRESAENRNKITIFTVKKEGGRKMGETGGIASLMNDGLSFQRTAVRHWSSNKSIFTTSFKSQSWIRQDVTQLAENVTMARSRTSFGLGGNESGDQHKKCLTCSRFITKNLTGFVRISMIQSQSNAHGLIKRQRAPVLVLVLPCD